jgi:hypothetical protein
MHVHEVRPAAFALLRFKLEMSRKYLLDWGTAKVKIIDLYTSREVRIEGAPDPPIPWTRPLAIQTLTTNSALKPGISHPSL